MTGAEVTWNGRRRSERSARSGRMPRSGVRSWGCCGASGEQGNAGGVGGIEKVGGRGAVSGPVSVISGRVVECGAGRQALRRAIRVPAAFELSARGAAVQ